MKISELKLRVANTANKMIDTYFGGTSLTEKFINSTLKIIVKQNIHKADDMLALFTDADGEVDANMIISEYSNILGPEGLVFDIREYVPNEAIRSMIPNKVLILKKEDILSILQ